jgi:NADPH:quinone reductase-like Zn-dependent oxidoreductase
MIFDLHKPYGKLDPMQQTEFEEGQRPNRSLNGQPIVLIGGASGFGFATTKAAADEGAAIIVASSSKAKVDKGPLLNGARGSRDGYHF